jgi:hypothetical protein
MTNEGIKAPLSVFVDADGTVDIIDADGWHVCRMEDMGTVGEQKAVLLCDPFNRWPPND